MVRAWVQPSFSRDWKSGWLVGVSGSKVLIAYNDDRISVVPEGLRLETVELHACRLMRTAIDFLPDAAKGPK